MKLQKFQNKILFTSTIVLIVVGVVSDIGGSFQALKDFYNFVCPVKISLLWIAPILLVGAGFGYLIARDRRTSDTESNSIANRGSFFNKIQAQFSDAQNEIVAIGLEKDWVLPLIVSVALARIRGVSITVLYFLEEHERYNLLSLLGCRVQKLVAEEEGDKIIGVVSDADQILSARAVFRTARQSETTYGRYYSSPIDYSAISALKDQALGKTDLPEPSIDFKPEIVEVSDEELISRMKAVKFYTDAQVQIQEINVAETIPTSGFVVPFKLRQAEDLIRYYESRGWSLFRPTGLALQNENTSLIIPPVMEEHDGYIYVIEGHSRLYTLKQRGVQKVRVVLVTGVEAKLPKEPSSWRRIVVADEKKEQRNHELARYIETSTHAGVWSMDAQ